MFYGAGSGTGSSNSSSAGPAASGSSTSGSSSIHEGDSGALDVRRSLFCFDFAERWLLFDLRDLPVLELFFEAELFFRALELLVRLFDSEDDRLEVAASTNGAAAAKKIIAARGIANLIIFTTSKNRIPVAARL